METKKILASSIYIYPSQNASDGGEINNENNLSSISKKLFNRNFVIKSATYDEPFRLSMDGSNLIVGPGECCIDGKYVHMSVQTTIALTDGGDVFIKLIKDSTGMVQGDVTNVDDRLIYCNGAEIQVGGETPADFYIRLGRVDYDGDNFTVSIDQDKYYFIDVTLIKDFTNNQSLIQYILSDVMNELDFPEKGQKTTITQAVIYGDTNATYAGNSDQIARADHSHDSRYVHKINDTRNGYSDMQVVYTPLHVTKDITLGTTINSPSIRLNASTGEIRANKVYNAVWNDYAELFKKDSLGKNIEPGTIIAKVPGKMTYTVADEYNKHLVVGVCSDSYGFLLGGEKGKTEEENLYKYIPVATAGRVKVKILGPIKEGDLVKVGYKGRAVKAGLFDRIFNKGGIVGKALEESGDKNKIWILVIPR